MNEISKNVTRYYFADLILDVQRGILIRNSNEILLPKLSYELLLALVAASPTLLTQQDLMTKVWPNVVIGDETLKQRIKLLRKSITDNATSPTYIEAVRGRGYRLIPEVTLEHIISKPSAVMLDLTANDRFPNLSSQQLTGAWKLVSKISLVLLFSIITFLSIFFHNANEVTEKFDELTVAVTDQLLAIMDNKKEPFNSQKIALEYYQKGAQYYKRYRAIDNIIAIDFFKKAIATRDDFSLAYAGLSQAYSQNIFQFNGEESYKIKAINSAYQAIVYDNQSAESYKALGTAYYVSGWLSKSIDPYLKSIKLLPKNNDSISNVGFIYSEQGKLVEALRWNEKALTNNSKHVVSMVHAGQTLQRLGHINLARKWYKKAIEQQPDYLLATFYLGQLETSLGNFKLAEGLFLTALELYKNQPLLLEGLALCYYFSGEIDLAADLYKNISIRENNKHFSPVKVMKLLSLNASAQEINIMIALLEKELSTGSDKPAHSYNLALLYAYNNEKSRAIRYLVQSIEQGWMSESFIEKQPQFLKFKALPSFKQLLTTIKVKRYKANQMINKEIIFW